MKYKIAICDDSREDVEVLESVFDKLHHLEVEYDIYFSADELLMYIEKNAGKKRAGAGSGDTGQGQ